MNGGSRDLDCHIRPLEAVRAVAVEYGLDTSNLKPCVAFLLDGNIGGAGRHEAAFVLGLELRRMGLDERDMQPHVRSWAKKVEYRRREAARNALDAYKTKPDGSYRYRPPGLTKGVRATAVLGGICADVGCPANCSPLAHVRRGPRSETLGRFEELGWPGVLASHQRRAAVDVYGGICALERQRGFGPGTRLRLSYEQLVQPGVSKTTVARSLRQLSEYGLITFVPGKGRAAARDEWASEVTRVMPIPAPPTEWLGCL